MSRFAGPRVLMGDFNAMPDAPVLEQFRQAGWVDAWTTLRAGDPGHTFESNAPDKRIDYVWVSSDLAPRLHAIDIVSAPPGSDVRLSDHHGICVTLAESP
jgi:endonuclease/exonuclease/phosphatase family metal-dependent hydrolase